MKYYLCLTTLLFLDYKNVNAYALSVYKNHQSSFDICSEQPSDSMIYNKLFLSFQSFCFLEVTEEFLFQLLHNFRKLNNR